MKQEFDNKIPIYVQLVEKIKILVISGKLSPGERLPSVREWSLRFQVNPNTLQKALMELEEDGLIFTERTNGKYVTTDPERVSFYREEYADRLTRQYFQNMRDVGYAPQQVISRLKNQGGD